MPDEVTLVRTLRRDSRERTGRRAAALGPALLAQWFIQVAFLEHDGVPWNNNNAEHAIKAFVRLRNIVRGSSTAKGLQEYLVLLSISETCKCKGVSFLDFLLSGDVDVDTFVRQR